MPWRKKFCLILGVCFLAVFCCVSCITIHPCATKGFRLFQFCTLLLSFAATMMYVIVSFTDSNRGNIICKRVVPAVNKSSSRVSILLLLLGIISVVAVLFMFLP